MGFEEIFVICIVIILATFIIIWIHIDKKNIKTVLDKSERIAQLISLNTETHFIALQPIYLYTQTCNSKRQFDRFSLDDYLVALIDSNESFYQAILNKVSLNIAKYDEYVKRLQDIDSNATEDFCNTFGFTLNKFLRYENRLFNDIVLPEPQIDVDIQCKATYTSPKGRNHYCKEKSYNYTQLKLIFEYTIKLRAKKETRQYQIKLERSKMTDSLRYDILKRDNFRCQICGSNVQDGVKLHVDHIIPVAKGGKTCRSNLRTLCDRCNIGKSDKI